MNKIIIVGAGLSGATVARLFADSGKDEFNEIFKLIFAKIWDEKQAEEERPDHKVEFRKALDDARADGVITLEESALLERFLRSAIGRKA